MAKNTCLYFVLDKSVEAGSGGFEGRGLLTRDVNNVNINLLEPEFVYVSVAALNVCKSEPVAHNKNYFFEVTSNFRLFTIHNKKLQIIC